MCSLRALVVGAITRDLEVLGDEVRSRAGGVVHHAGLALARLGAETRIVTRLRSDDAPDLLGRIHAEGIETRALPSLETTTYLNDYTGDQDAHEIRAVSDPIRAEDVPPAWRRADIIHLGPLHRGDIDPDLPASLHGFKGIDLQGLLREATDEGTRLAPFEAIGDFVRSVDVVQASSAELEPTLAGASLEEFVRRHSIREMIVTHGALGATLLTASDTHAVPARGARRVYPVGAGDVFLAAYLFLRSGGRSPLQAALGAGDVCAEKLERGEVPKGFLPVFT